MTVVQQLESVFLPPVFLLVIPVASPIRLLLAFCTKILGGGGDLWMILCHSMDTGGGTQTQPAVIEFISTF